MNQIEFTRELESNFPSKEEFERFLDVMKNSRFPFITLIYKNDYFFELEKYLRELYQDSVPSKNKRDMQKKYKKLSYEKAEEMHQAIFTERHYSDYPSYKTIRNRKEID
jgi:hypothetical protein